MYVSVCIPPRHGDCSIMFCCLISPTQCRGVHRMAQFSWWGDFHLDIHHLLFCSFWWTLRGSPHIPYKQSCSRAHGQWGLDVHLEGNKQTTITYSADGRQRYCELNVPLMSTQFDCLWLLMVINSHWWSIIVLLCSSIVRKSTLTNIVRCCIHIRSTINENGSYTSL